MSTGIEWCEETWNPVTGCAPISEGCAHCYAKRMAESRLRGRCGYPADDPFRPGLVHPEKWDQPLRWKKPRMIFVCSMGDLFHDAVGFGLVDKVLAHIALCPQHTFMLLTKRPKRMADYFSRDRRWDDDLGEAAYSLGYSDEANCAIGNSINGWLGDGLNVGWPMRNLWLGVTAENQAMADKRIPILLQIPAAMRFVSVEPMLEAVDLTNIRAPEEYQDPMALWDFEKRRFNALDTECEDHLLQAPVRLGLVIVGGETGPGARPMHPNWVRQIRDDCQAAGVPFFFKSWGEWCPGRQNPELSDQYLSKKPCRLLDYNGCSVGTFRVGKRAAGRELDGRTWDEMPEVKNAA